ncbi:inward rectifier potassium channel protein [Gregarina niphandrodes]|uniref:Inward rectifier potassium channel protein n=1 Tax=Gregarina niphandrodes TaxID=110365 RepID=A0A023B5Q2_GRENI|nr:inward rectifier potassium channel protein [Gregarina niphandrodes]EZG60711.1 inward rectifier potassium channel protein [Gregarina niphandrodes]|eukprot:XP_011130820.1 inward rectifier potassium channel protein [Gregarina niphandrodes]
MGFWLRDQFHTLLALSFRQLVLVLVLGEALFALLLATTLYVMTGGDVRGCLGGNVQGLANYYYFAIETMFTIGFGAPRHPSCTAANVWVSGAVLFTNVVHGIVIGIVFSKFSSGTPRRYAMAFSPSILGCLSEDPRLNSQDTARGRDSAAGRFFQDQHTYDTQGYEEQGHDAKCYGQGRMHPLAPAGKQPGLPARSPASESTKDCTTNARDRSWRRLYSNVYSGNGVLNGSGMFSASGMFGADRVDYNARLRNQLESRTQLESRAFFDRRGYRSLGAVSLGAISLDTRNTHTREEGKAYNTRERQQRKGFSQEGGLQGALIDDQAREDEARVRKAREGSARDDELRATADFGSGPIGSVRAETLWPSAEDRLSHLEELQGVLAVSEVDEAEEAALSFTAGPSCVGNLLNSHTFARDSREAQGLVTPGLVTPNNYQVEYLDGSGYGGEAGNYVADDPEAGGRHTSEDDYVAIDVKSPESGSPLQKFDECNFSLSFRLMNLTQCAFFDPKLTIFLLRHEPQDLVITQLMHYYTDLPLQFLELPVTVTIHQSDLREALGPSCLSRLVMEGEKYELMVLLSFVDNQSSRLLEVRKSWRLSETQWGHAFQRIVKKERKRNWQYEVDVECLDNKVVINTLPARM